MFLSIFVSSVECALMTLEAYNVVSLRLQMISKGDAEAVRESEIMISEKIEAFSRAGFDALKGVSNDVIRNNFRTAIRANEMRLKALQS